MNCRTPLLSLATVMGAALLPITTHGGSLWVEGESGEGRNISPNSWYLSVREADLSGGAWLATYGGKEDAFASYSAKVEEAGKYALWVRANPIQASMQMRFGETGEWIKVPISEKKIDHLNIAADGKPDMRFLAWTQLGPFDLDAGELEITFRMDSKNGRHGAIDCFCFTTDLDWKPNKTAKPGEPVGWPAPEINAENLRRWGDFIRPSKEDAAWRDVRWHKHLDEAAAEAKELERPILLWAMNGHPCGET